jgi:hypothetical protein
MTSWHDSKGHIYSINDLIKEKKLSWVADLTKNKGIKELRIKK